MSNAVLRFDNWGYRHASRRYFSVRGLNLTVEAGQRVLLLGASGIGKSTILEGAAGLLGSNGYERQDPGQEDGIMVDAEGGATEGHVFVDDVPVHEAIGRVGLVLQDPDAQAVFQRLGDNVAFGPENLHVERGEIWRRVDSSLAAVGLQGLQLHRSVTHLSGGQMQRLALAGALAMRPSVLLLDEPTANLDPDGVTQVVTAVRDVLDEFRSTMVLVEHHAEPWIDLIDRVIVLGSQTDQDTANGQERHTVIMADGTPDEVFRDPNLDFARLGIWVPRRYMRGECRIGAIHTGSEPDYPACEGTGEPVLCTKNLAIGRNGKAVATGIDLAFKQGQITALVGANGAGKSTLALTLAGLLEPVDGEVSASGELAAGAHGVHPGDWKSTELASRISYVFQNPEHQFATGSVLDEVMLGPLRVGVEESQARERARTLLRRFDLLRYENANPYTLSGGEKRRLTVAAALASAPRVLILDEPTFGQDRCTWMQMVQLIHGLRSDGVSIIVVTHDRELVTALGARVIELQPENSRREWEPAQDGHGDSAGDDVVAVTSVNTRDEAERQSSRSPFLASLNPAYRLIGGFLAALPMLLSLDWLSSGTMLVLEFAVLAVIGITPWRTVRSTWPVFVGAPFSALAVLLYGKSGGDTWWQWGLMRVTDRSAELALATALRILAIGIPAIIAVLGIDVTDLADSFSQILHLPDRFVYGGLAGMRLFSVLQDDWAALSASRRSRGLGDDNALRAFLPQSFALLVLSIRRSTTLATAMQARGFGGSGPRSHARVSEVHVRDRVFLAACLALPVASLCLALRFGMFSFFGN
ncbi:ATP-binding cassette domain-containing protein [Bifidobacterium angulatum]|uniref:ATP-binding cassette domain-containing protein n=1 Tax=Bifidobacterium angulatum TaxID=1683 RepID=UPI00265ACF52|nr:ATP-binding cassette domain-containing protein [Bifidobacterium angulatum]